MPHQCVRCSKILEDGSKELLNGCECGAKLFFFVKQSFLDQNKKKDVVLNKLSSEDKERIEQDVYELVGEKNTDDVVILDLENVNVNGPGKYELDLVSLFKNDPIVYKMEEGKYVIDIAEAFKGN